MRRPRVALIVLATGLVAVVPAVFAFRDGVLSGYSGGPESSGWNCVSCHGFNQGAGNVELIGAPDRYRFGAVYDLTVRVSDADKVGAGFEISAEGEAPGHVGTFLISDATHTQFSHAVHEDYVTHTLSGVADSISNWASGGGSYDYHLQWRAPFGDVGRINFYASANAIDDDAFLLGDNYYFAYATAAYSAPFDVDGDGDVDLADFAVLQRCYSGVDPAAGGECGFVDLNGDGMVTALEHFALTNVLSGPIDAEPAGLIAADYVRGGLLYDKWWAVAELGAPGVDHPLWATRPDQTSNTRTGSTTWRCKECHGWDYKGVDGAYGSGSHRTGFSGIFGSTMSPGAVFELLKKNEVTVPGGHGFGDTGLSDDDIWDLVAFVRSGLVDTDTHVDTTDPAGPFLGTSGLGLGLYQDTCYHCHGSDGTDLNFNTPESPSYVGTVANGNPWEFLHKVRFGHPGSSMPPGEKLRWDAADAADIGAYAQGLPTE